MLDFPGYSVLTNSWFGAMCSHLQSLILRERDRLMSIFIVHKRFNYSILLLQMPWIRDLVNTPIIHFLSSELLF